MDELKRLQSRRDGDRDELSLLHELQVYQEEIVAQNEQLLHVQAALEETRDQFVELYDFAPNGYLTLNRHGVVVRINLTGAALFGRNRQSIEGTPLIGLVARDGRPVFLDFLRRSRRCRDGQQLEAEIKIQSADGPRIVQFICQARISSTSHERELLTSMVDISERKRLELERDRAAREHAALAGRLLTVQDNERQRIARDLHDDLGQEVTALRLQLDVISSKMADTDTEALREVRRMLERLDGRLHLIATELRPASLDLGIVAAVQQYVQRWSSTLGIPAEFHSRGLDRRRLRPDVETQLYRVTQEALNNIHKHAGATRVAVLLERRDDGLVLIVEDNGRGCRPRRGDGDARLGMIGMRERAQSIGGRLEVESAPGRGTTVFLHLPNLAAALG